VDDAQIRETVAAQRMTVEISRAIIVPFAGGGNDNNGSVQASRQPGEAIEDRRPDGASADGHGVPGGRSGCGTMERRVGLQEQDEERMHA
jgi:hypothetical protein